MQRGDSLQRAQRCASQKYRTDRKDLTSRNLAPCSQFKQGTKHHQAAAIGSM